MDFKLHKAIKAHSLVDFVVECTISADSATITFPQTETPRTDTFSTHTPIPTIVETWKLFTDGSLAQKKVGDSIYLFGTWGEQFEYSVRYIFPPTNNVDDYEALFTGLDRAKKIKVSCLDFHADNQLVTK